MSIAQCSSLCLSKNRDTVNAFNVSRALGIRCPCLPYILISCPNQKCQPGNNECFCKIVLDSDNSLPCIDCILALPLAVHLDMTAADLRHGCVEEILSSNPTAQPSSTPTSSLATTLSSGALGSAYTSLIAAASSSSSGATAPIATGTASGSVPMTNKYQALCFSVVSGLICGLHALVF